MHCSRRRIAVEGGTESAEMEWNGTFGVCDLTLPARASDPCTDTRFSMRWVGQGDLEGLRGLYP